MTNLLRHEELCKELTRTYEQKNHDYGDAFSKTFIEEGMAMPRIRIGDKFRRFCTLSRGEGQKVSDESLKDTLMDMANYCLMTVIELENRH